VIPPSPAMALLSLRQQFARHPWYRGADLQGIGLDAIIVVRTADLQAAQEAIDRLGGRWGGYRLQPRRVE
jgi:hypothetical protein